MATPAVPMSLSIVIPAFNERDTLPKILPEVLKHGPETQTEVIVVDDGSTDGTRDWLAELTGQRIGKPVRLALADDGTVACVDTEATAPESVSLLVHFQPTNQGKGAALRTGFGLSCHDVIVVQDADLEYDPADLREMFATMQRGVADVVYGSRFYGRPHRSLYLHHYLGNWLISRMVNVLCNATLTDVEVCYKMFRREVLDGMKLKCNDFGFEVEFTIKMLMTRRWRVYEQGICYYGRTYDEGKKISWKDGVKALWYILRFRFS